MCRDNKKDIKAKIVSIRALCPNCDEFIPMLRVNEDVGRQLRLRSTLRGIRATRGCARMSIDEKFSFYCERCKKSKCPKCEEPHKKDEDSINEFSEISIEKNKSILNFIDILLDNYKVDNNAMYTNIKNNSNLYIYKYIEGNDATRIVDYLSN